MRKLIKYLLLVALCLSVYVFTSCANAEYVTAYEPSPTVYYYPYPVKHYYVHPRHVYLRPAPPPHRPVIVMRQHSRRNGYTYHPNVDKRGGNKRYRHR
jgi:hypothetical protein